MRLLLRCVLRRRMAKFTLIRSSLVFRKRQGKLPPPPKNKDFSLLRTPKFLGKEGKTITKARSSLQKKTARKSKKLLKKIRVVLMMEAPCDFALEPNIASRRVAMPWCTQASAFFIFTVAVKLCTMKSPLRMSMWILRSSLRLKLSAPSVAIDHSSAIATAVF